MFPTAAEHLAQNRIVRLLETFRLLVEPRQVPLNDGFHARERVVLGNGPTSTNRNSIDDVSGLEKMSEPRQDVRVVIIIGQLIEKRARLENESGQNDFR